MKQIKKPAKKQQLDSLFKEMEQSAVVIRRHQLDFDFKAPKIPERVTDKDIDYNKKQLAIIKAKANEYIQLEDETRRHGKQAEPNTASPSGLSFELRKGRVSFRDEIREEYTKQYFRVQQLLIKIEQEGYTLPYQILPDRVEYPTTADIEQLKGLQGANINAVVYRVDETTGEVFTREQDIYNKRVETTAKNAQGAGDKKKEPPKTHREKPNLTDLPNPLEGGTDEPPAPQEAPNHYMPDVYRDPEAAAVSEADVILDNLIFYVQSHILASGVSGGALQAVTNELAWLKTEFASLSDEARRETASFIIDSEEELRLAIEQIIYASTDGKVIEAKREFDNAFFAIHSAMSSAGIDFDSEVGRRTKELIAQINSPEYKQYIEAIQNLENEL